MTLFLVCFRLCSDNSMELNLKSQLHVVWCAFRQRETQDLEQVMADQSMHRAPNKDILDHGRKRQMVLELLTMREELEDLGYAATY